MAGIKEWFKQGFHHSGTPGKVTELKLCLKSQGNVREFESLYLPAIANLLDHRP